MCFNGGNGLQRPTNELQTEEDDDGTRRNNSIRPEFWAAIMPIFSQLELLHASTCHCDASSREPD